MYIYIYKPNIVTILFNITLYHYYLVYKHIICIYIYLFIYLFDVPSMMVHTRYCNIYCSKFIVKYKQRNKHVIRQYLI